MSHIRGEILMFVFVFIFAFVCVVDAQTKTARKFEPIPDELSDFVLGRREQILIDLGNLKNDEWSGKYRSFDALTLTTRFDWTVTNGFTAWRENCSRPGDVRVNYGSANFANNLLTISPERTDKSQHTLNFAPTFVPVKWGEQHWLIPADEVIPFIYTVNSEDNERIETYFVKADDYEKTRNGSPKVPQEYEKYLNMKPLSAKVTFVKKKDEDFYTSLTLNIGTSEGVIDGMVFYLVGVKNVLVKVVVEKASEHKSDVYMSSYGRSDDYEQDIKPVVGWKFTSKMPEGY